MIRDLHVKANQKIQNDITNDTHLNRQQSSKFSAHLQNLKWLQNAGICHISGLAYHSKVVII